MTRHHHHFAFAVAVLAIVLFAPRVSADDDPNPDATFRKAVEMQQKSESQRKEAEELEKKAGKAEDADTKDRLQKQAKELRQSADNDYAEVRKVMEQLAPRDRKGYGRAHL